MLLLWSIRKIEIPTLRPYVDRRCLTKRWASQQDKNQHPSDLRNHIRGQSPTDSSVINREKVCRLLIIKK